MIFLALSLLVAAVDPRVERVVAAVGEPGCPKLYGMLTESFQKAAPAQTWPSWCASVGALTELEPLGTKGGWMLFRGKSNVGAVLFDVAFDGSNRISGIRSKAIVDVGPSLDDKLIALKEKYGLPGLAALVLLGGKGAILSSVGVRKVGDSTPVTLEDKWHLGSDTKAMTATLAAILVEEKKLKWSSTVTQVLSGWKDIHPDFATITLEVLLTHRAGLPANVPNEVWKKVFNPKDTAKERTEAARAVLRVAPQQVGTFAYSNAGYMVAGVMLEKASGQSWELAMRKRLFGPLQMTSCGFGPPASAGKVNQPWAHLVVDGVLTAVAPGPESDNPLGIGPAGTVHCSMVDWSKFIDLHLKAARGEKTLLSPEAIVKLQTAPEGGKYAMGWAVDDRTWAGGKVLRHSGSNTMFYATVEIAPQRNLAFLIATNVGTDDAETAINELSEYFAARYGG